MCLPKELKINGITNEESSLLENDNKSKYSGILKKNSGRYPLNSGRIDVQELKCRISGMSKEEMEIALTCIPAELCFQRLIQEFKNNQETIMYISQMLNKEVQ